MKFYSKVTEKPNVIIEQVKDGTRTISNKRICVFRNGVFETLDPKIIAKLQQRPDLFRTDRPWIEKNNWRTTEKGKKLLEEGTRLGVNCKNIREWYLEKLIGDKKKELKEAPKTPEPEVKVEAVEKVEIVSIVEETPVVAPEVPKVKIDYEELMKIAKQKGWTARKRVDIERLIKGEKKEDISKDIREKEVK